MTVTFKFHFWNASENVYQNYATYICISDKFPNSKSVLNMVSNFVLSSKLRKACSNYMT